MEPTEEEKRIEIQSFTNELLDESLLPTTATIEYSPLEKNYLKAESMWVALFYSVLCIVVLVLKYGFEVPWVVNYGHWILLGLVFLFIISILLIYFGFYKKSYAIREKDIIYNKGLFWRSSIAIPFNRVQHCEVAIGPIDRMFGLSELKIFTAGGASSDLTIHGLRPDTSNRLKDYIVNKTSQDEEE